MNNISFVHVLDTLADLSHVIDDLGFGHGIAFSRNLLEKLSAAQARIYAGH